MDVVLSKSASAAATTAASASAQVWRATVDKNAVSYEWGQQGGKMQKKLCVYDVGKQKRSADEQATFEALSNARKKIRMGYTVVRGPPELTAATDAYTSPKPMLALPFDEYIERVAHKQHPARYFVQPKLDGIRCLAHLPSGKLYSRGRKPILGCEHIEAALRQLPLNADTQEMCEIWLDGELYRHGLTFQTITSMARKNVNLSSESAALQVHCGVLCCTTLHCITTLHYVALRHVDIDIDMHSSTTSTTWWRPTYRSASAPNACEPS
jgi:hypothetical protein